MMVRRQIGDLIRSIANRIDPPKRITITPIVLRLDARLIADTTLKQTLTRTTRHIALGERCIGRVFGWL